MKKQEHERSDSPATIEASDIDEPIQKLINNALRSPDKLFEQTTTPSPTTRKDLLLLKTLEELPGDDKPLMGSSSSNTVTYIYVPEPKQEAPTENCVPKKGFCTIL